MPIYSYEGVHYDIAETDPEKAKSKILAHLGNKVEEPKPVAPIDTPMDTIGKVGAAGAGSFNQLLGLGTLGLPSLGVDKAVQAITGDENYMNPVSKYLTDMVEQQNVRKKEAEQSAAQNPISGMVGNVLGMIPEMVAGGVAAGPMKTMTGTAGQVVPQVMANLQKGIAAAQPMAVTAGVNKYEDSLEKGNTALESASAGMGSWGNMTMQGAMPMGAAGNLLKRVATGAATNVPTGMVGRQLENVMAPQNMQQEVFDPKAMAMDALLGGTMHGLNVFAKGEAPTKKPESPMAEQPDAKQMANDKLVYTERRLEAAQTRLEELKTQYGKATTKEGRERVRNAITQQIEYVNKETNSLVKLKTFLGKTDEQVAKEELQQTSDKVAEAEKEMEVLNQEYHDLSRKGAALTKEDSIRLEEIQNRYNELADFSEQHAAKLFGEESTPIMEKYDPRLEEEAKIEEQIDAPVREDVVVSDNFVPGRNRSEVNESIVSRDYSGFSNDVLDRMIENKQSKIVRSKNPEMKALMQNELQHLQQERQSRGVDPKVYGETGKVSPELQASVKNNNLRQGLQAIADNATMPWFNRQVAKALLKNERIGKFTKLFYDQQAKYEAYTQRDTGDVVFRDTSTVTPTNYLHEAIHSATSGMLLAFRKGTRFDHQTTRAINQLIDIQESLNGRLKNQFLAEFSKFSSNAHVDIETVLTNERELLAYALTDTGVRHALESIQWNGKSYMRKLIDSVSDMMGWTGKKERSILEAITESGDILIQNSNGRGLMGQSGVDAIRQLTPTGDVGYHFNNKLLNTVTNLPNQAALRLLNAQAIKNFWKHNPLIQKSANLVELANRRMESTRSLLLHGTNLLSTYTKGNFFTRMSKMEAPDGLLPALGKVSFPKVGEMVPVLFQAARDGVVLSENLARYGADIWTPEQKHLAKIMETTVDRVFQMANESLTARGLPPVKSWGPGYIPVHIGKPFYLDVSVNGELLRREWFLTETQAKKAQEHFAKDPNFETRTGEKEPNVDYDSIEQALREILETNKNHPNISLHNSIEAKLQEIALNNSSVGSHKQHKDLLRGFAGDTTGKTVEQQGKDFAHALEQWVNEYTNSIRKREILYDQAKLEATQPHLIENNPNAYEITRYMISNEIGELKSFMKIGNMEGKVSEAFNKTANEIAVQLGMKNLDRDILPYAYSLLTRGAYNMVLTSSPTVWLTQTLGFMNAQRMYFKDLNANPLHGFEAAAKGLSKVLFQKYDPELMEAMHYVSQNFETLHKHLTNEISDFQWNEDKQHISNKIYRFVTGETFTTNADAISRTICFAQAVEFLKLQGKSGEKMWIEAARMTDDNMNAFGKKNLAGIYKELGAAGTIIAPLKSFIHHQAGLLATDIKDVVQTPSVNSVLALTANMLSLLMMGGLIGTPFLADYEYLRSLLVKSGKVAYDTLPSWTETVEGMDPLLSRGVLSATGIDMGASMRYSSVFKPFGDIASADSLTDIALPLTVATKFASGMGTLASNIMGGASDAEVSQAIKSTVPRGLPQGTMDMLLNQDKRNTTLGNRGQGLTKRETDEVVAKFFGSRSVDEAHESTKNQQLDMRNKSINGQKQKAIDMFLSTGQGDKAKGIAIAKKLIASGDWTQEEFVNAAKNMKMQQLRTVNSTSIMSNKGKMSTANLRNYKFLQGMEYDDNR